MTEGRQGSSRGERQIPIFSDPTGSWPAPRSQIKSAVAGFGSPLYRVDQEQPRTDSRSLYLMAWKAAPARKVVRARRWDYHASITGKALIRRITGSELQADPVPRPGSWSEPKSTLITMTREKNYFSTPISRMKESKGVLESPRAGLDDRMSSF